MSSDRDSAATALMRQYLDIKARYPDAILFFRLGDFYEMFYEDAVYVARTLSLTLTSRDKGKEDPTPMCGVPHHSARNYVQRLTELGHRVAICEQLEDPKLTKGMVKRGVVRVITPGVITRTTPRLTMPLVSLGSSSCSHRATRWPSSVRRWI